MPVKKSSPLPTPEHYLERYREELSTLDMTDEQKLEMINAVQTITRTLLSKKFDLP